MAQLSELSTEVRDDPVFSRYLQLLGTNLAALQIEESPSDQAPILQDCRDRLQRMAFVFNKESPGEFTRNTIQAFGWLFNNFIHSIVTSPDLPDNIIRGNLKVVKQHIFAAKRAFSLALINSNNVPRLDLYNDLNDCTLSFENALGQWEPKEAYSNLFSADQIKMTATECRLKLVEILEYFAPTAYVDTKAWVQYEDFLRKNIILNILDATDEDISSKAQILPPLRKAKINLILALDEEKIKPQSPESQKRLITYLGESEQCLNEALTLWRDA